MALTFDCAGNEKWWKQNSDRYSIVRNYPAQEIGVGFLKKEISMHREMLNRKEAKNKLKKK